MHLGSRVAWEDRKHDDELSALQHAYNLKFDMGDAAFLAEYQNDPPKEEATDNLLSKEDIAAKVNGYQRQLIPADAVHLSAFVDVQGKLLYWVVAAWRPDFTGYVVDYGAWPEQRRSYFTLADAVPTIPDLCNGGLESQLYAALTSLVDSLCGREWVVDGGQSMKLGKCLIDANWGESTPTIYSFCRQSPHAAVLLPTHGRGVKASGAPIMNWAKQDGEQVGLNWRIRRTTQKHAPIRHGIYDTNYWKSFCHARLFVPLGGSGCLSLFKAGSQQHRMLADHLHAEYPIPVESQGRKVSEWQNRPDRPDNHLFDCLVGCCVGGSMLGAALREQAPKAKRDRKPLNQMGK
jgi:phage terminase large subunit GpA-like protein